MGLYNTITFGGVELKVTRIRPTKRQKTVKQMVGRSVSQINIIGLDAQQWELDITGVITGSENDMLSGRSALVALSDSKPHMLVDGVHNGYFYVVPGSLAFDDVGDSIHSIYRYTMTLIEV